jgi:hypothetical protein
MLPSLALLRVGGPTGSGPVSFFEDETLTPGGYVKGTKENIPFYDANGRYARFENREDNKIVRQGFRNEDGSVFVQEYKDGQKYRHGTWTRSEGWTFFKD